VIEQKPWLLRGFSRDEVADALLTYLENIGLSHSLGALLGAANFLSQKGELPSRTTHDIPGVRVVENPSVTTRHPFSHPVEFVERTERLTWDKVSAMTADEYAKACRNPEFLKAMQAL
jgi:hypothetical protein